ncbi:MAG: NVEALA domain-containing protein [Candidatus Cryptobacteroides sp.]
MKKIIISIAALVVAAAATVAMASRSESDSLFVANVEALAEIETGEYTCYNSIKASEGHKIMYCPICDYIDGTDTIWGWASSCTK